MTLALAVRGALGFLSRLPVGASEAAWDAFRRTPASFPLAGYAIGGLVAAPVVVPAAFAPGTIPTATLVVCYLVALYLLTGITHLDGVADLGDAAVVHGDPADRREVLKDTRTGVGGTAAVVCAVVALALGALALFDLGSPLAVAGLLVAAEVSAKLGMALVVCLGRSPVEGLGSAVTAPNDARALPATVAVALPAALLAWPGGAAAVALLGGPVAALVCSWWADRRLGGVNGDVVGAVNELGRVLALHAGVVAL